MKARLVALDIDGTLVPPDGPYKGTLSPRLRAAVSALVADGRTVVLASGRMSPGIISVAKELGLHSPIIAQDGCVTATMDGAIVREVRLEQGLALAVTAYAREAGCAYEWFSAQRYVVTEASRATTVYAELGGVTHEVHPRPETLGIEPNGVGVISDRERAPVVHRELAQRFGDALHLLDFPAVTVALAPEASKANALARLADDLDITRHEAVAIGDSVNDASMLAWAGRGLATANADRYALDAADESLPDEVDAVAQALEGLL